MAKVQTTTARVLIYALLITLSVFMMLPFVWMLSTSFKPMNEVFVRPPILISQNFNLDAYRYVFEEAGALRALGNTIFVASAASGAERS